MSPLVEGNTVKFIAQCQAAEIPSMRRQGAAVQKQQRRQFLVAPVKVTETKVTDGHGLFARQYDISEAEAGTHRRSLQVIVIFVRG